MVRGRGHLGVRVGKKGRRWEGGGGGGSGVVDGVVGGGGAGGC